MKTWIITFPRGTEIIHSTHTEAGEAHLRKLVALKGATIRPA